MHSQTSQRKTIDIGDGLIMRWSTNADTENVANLVGDSFRVTTCFCNTPIEIYINACQRLTFPLSKTVDDLG